jgi:hypothetical protein
LETVPEMAADLDSMRASLAALRMQSTSVPRSARIRMENTAAIIAQAIEEIVRSRKALKQTQSGASAEMIFHNDATAFQRRPKKKQRLLGQADEQLARSRVADAQARAWIVRFEMALDEFEAAPLKAEVGGTSEKACLMAELEIRRGRPQVAAFPYCFLAGRFQAELTCDFKGLPCHARLFGRTRVVSGPLTQNLVLPAVECSGSGSMIFYPLVAACMADSAPGACAGRGGRLLVAFQKERLA